MFGNGTSFIFIKLKEIVVYPIPLYYIPMSCSFYFFPRETLMVGTTFWLFNSLNEETERRKNNVPNSTLNEVTEYEDSSEDESTSVNDKTTNNTKVDNEMSNGTSDTSSSVDEKSIDTINAVHGDNNTELTSTESDELLDDTIKFDNNSSVNVSNEDLLQQVAESKTENILPEVVESENILPEVVESENENKKYLENKEYIQYIDEEDEDDDIEVEDIEDDDDIDVQPTGWWFFNLISKEKTA
tara:strand:+ start:142 stop:870 length:729 start_codon:yes stop_codon:yes gene_type:complete